MPETETVINECTKEQAKQHKNICEKGRVLINFLVEEHLTPLNEQEIITGPINTPYVSPHGATGKTIADYNLEKTTGVPVSGLYKKADQVLNYIYSANPKTIDTVILQFVDFCTGKLITPTEALSGLIGSTYSSPYSTVGKIIPHFTLVDCIGAPVSGTFTESSQTITYRYRCQCCYCCRCSCSLTKGEVHIRFINQFNDEAIAATEFLKGNVGSSYSSPYGTTGKIITGFTLVNITGAPLNGTLSKVTKIITYVYRETNTPEP